MSSVLKITKLSAAASDISDDSQSQSKSACIDIKHLEIQIQELQQQIETKHSMLNTAASAGQQLVRENDKLHQQLKDTIKLLKEKQDELETYKRTNSILEITATRSAHEADELHKKLIESQSITQQLQEENALLTSMKRHSSVNRIASMHNSFDEETAKELISTLEHEKQTLEQFLRSEQEKCMEFLQNAEINARKLSHQQNENQDLNEEIAKLESENQAITTHSQHEIAKYSETLHQLQAENVSLRNNLQEQQIIVNDLNITNLGSPTREFFHRPFSTSDPCDEGLFGDLQASGYYQKYESHPRLLSTENADDDTQESTIDNDNTDNYNVRISHASPNQQFRRATVDAQEEFFRLTIIAAKIKFSDVPIATSVLWEKVKQAKLSFHELADWLNDYLLLERKKINEAQKQSQIDLNSQRIISASIKESNDNVAITPTKHFFRKIKDLADSVTNFSSTLRLEVRFGRRVFEVKMKKHDKLETLLQTLPRIIGEDAGSMEIMKENRRLDATQTLSDLLLINNDVLRMIHQKKVPSYLKRYEKKMLLQDDNNSAIEMSSAENTNEII